MIIYPEQFQHPCSPCWSWYLRVTSRSPEDVNEEESGSTAVSCRLVQHSRWFYSASGSGSSQEKRRSREANSAQENRSKNGSRAISAVGAIQPGCRHRFSAQRLSGDREGDVLAQSGMDQADGTRRR